MVSDVIDLDQDEGMLVAAGVSERLDALKQTYHGLPDFLTRVVRAELARIPRHLSDALAQQLWSIVYMPQVLNSCLWPPPLLAAQALLPAALLAIVLRAFVWRSS